MNEVEIMRWLRRDDGISSILGFIVAMVMLVASTAGVAYFIATQPDPQQEEGTQGLQSAATRAVSQLVTTPGQPSDWHTDPSSLERAGLLRDTGTGILDLEKVQALKEGAIDNEALLDALDLRTRGYSIHAKGEVHSNALIRAPSQGGFSIVAGDDVDDGYIADQGELDTGSWGDLQKVCTFNAKCANTIHNWEFNWTDHPRNGLGDVFPDHPWWIETQLVPKMAGLRATYVQGPVLNSSIPDSGDGSAQDTVFDRFDGGDILAPRWTIVQDNEDTCLPDDGSLDGKNDHALLLGRLANPNDKCTEGDDHRKLDAGYRAWTLLGPYDTTDADDLNLTFNQVLEITEGTDQNGNTVHYAPRIMFWNATKGETGEWDRIRQSHKPAQDGCSSGWDDQNPNATPTKVTTKQWTSFTVDLCQALEDGLGELWLSFYWDSWCTDENGDEVVCGPCETDSEGVSLCTPTLWALDDFTIEGTVEGTTHTFDELPLEPRGEHLFTFSSHVDHDLDQHDTNVWQDGHRVAARVWPRDLVRNGSNVLALQPGAAGNLLGGIGLESVATTSGSTGQVNITDHFFMRVPNALNTSAHGNGFASSAHAWSTSETQIPTSSGQPPENQLDAVHVNDAGDGTVMIGQPYNGGGTVAAIAYNLSTLQSDDPDLYDEFMINLLASMVFKDPTFELQGSDVPESVSSPVATARRVALVTVDEQARYMLPMEITVYLWEQCVDGNPSTDACDPPP